MTHRYHPHARKELDDATERLWRKFPRSITSLTRFPKNIVCIEVRTQKVLLYLKLDPKEIPNPPAIGRDLSSIGHFGTGDFEVVVGSQADLEIAKEFINLAYQKVGG
jgi:predicted transport protein